MTATPADLAVPSISELEALFYGRGTYRVMPAFAAPHEVDDAERLLRRVMDDPDVFFTLDGRDDGVGRLQRMALLDSRCSDFMVAADLLAGHPDDHLLVLGWSKR